MVQYQKVNTWNLPHKQTQELKPMIISLYEETAFVKIQHSFTLKFLGESRNTMGIPKHNRGNLQQPIAKILLNGEKLKAIPVKLEIRQGCSPAPCIINIVLEVLARAIRQLKEIKGIQTEREEVKVSLFTDMIVDISDHKNSTRELLQLINTFIKVTGYKINSDISHPPLYR